MSNVLDVDFKAWAGLGTFACSVCASTDSIEMLTGDGTSSTPARTFSFSS